MGALKNARHERFAQLRAKGRTATDAYIEAGFAANDSNAARLNGNERVAKRIAEILGKAAKRTELTVAGITEKLLALAEKAEGSNEAPMLSVARASYMDAAKLNGLVIDKAERTDVGTMTVTYVTSASGSQPAPSDEDYETAE